MQYHGPVELPAQLGLSVSLDDHISQYPGSFPITTKNCIVRRVANALVISIRCACSALIFHSTLSHDTARMGIVRIVPGRNPFHTDFREEIFDHSSQRLRHNAPMPPLTANAVADLPFFNNLILADHADRTDRLCQFFQYDHPLIVVVLIVSSQPTRQNLLCHFDIAMRWPCQIFGDFRIRCPIAEHRFRIFPSRSSQNESGSFCCLGPLMCQHG